MVTIDVSRRAAEKVSWILGLFSLDIAASFSITYIYTHTFVACQFLERAIWFTETRDTIARCSIFSVTTSQPANNVCAMKEKSREKPTRSSKKPLKQERKGQSFTVFLSSSGVSISWILFSLLFFLSRPINLTSTTFESTYFYASAHFPFVHTNGSAQSLYVLHDAPAQCPSHEHVVVPVTAASSVVVVGLGAFFVVLVAAAFFVVLVASVVATLELELELELVPPPPDPEHKSPPEATS